MLDKLKKELEQRLVTEWNREGEARSPLRLSALASCTRQLFYRHFGFKRTDDPEPRMKLIVDAGNYLHDKIRTSLLTIPGVKLSFVETRLELLIAGTAVMGHCDGVIDYKGTTILLDIKTMGTFPFRLAKKGESKEGYIRQQWAYRTALLKHSHIKKIDTCLVLAVNRDNMQMLFMDVTDEVTGDNGLKVKEDVKRSVTAFREAVDNKAIPATIDNDGKVLNWECAYCPFMTRCWDQEGVSLERSSYRWSQVKMTQRS